MTNVSLNVPLYRQPPRSRHCGAYAAKMVLAYHGRRVSASRLVRETKSEGGMYDIVLATWLAEHGMDVTVICWWDIFPPSFLDLRPEDTGKALLDWSRRAISPAASWRPIRTAYRRHLPRFYRNGGRFLTRPVTPDDVRRALVAGTPPIMEVDASVLTRLGRAVPDPHYLVVTGAGKTSFTVNDPNYQRSGGTQTYPTEQLLHACYRTGSEIIVARPAK